MHQVAVFVLVAFLCTVMCKPLEVEISDVESTEAQHHSLKKRFINPMFELGGPAENGVTKMRTKREAEECEKLALCKLHARSQQNFIAAFQLYFINKENARLWDHHARSIADCEQRYGDCYDK